MEESTDSFSGNEWELSKENVQPLKQGRKMANLTAALAPSSVDQTRIFREKQWVFLHFQLQQMLLNWTGVLTFLFLRFQREFEAQIRTYEGDDPLEIWYR